MQTYTIKRISRTDKVSKSDPSKTYVSVGIQVAELGDTWINGFGNAQNAKWEVGDQVQLIITDKEFNGKTYKNFEMPKVSDEVSQLKTKIGHLESKVSILWEEHKRKTDRLTSAGTPVPFPDDEINVDDIPLE